MWLNELKIAIIEENTDKLNILMDSLPELTKPQEIDEALHLLQAATALVESLRNNTQNAMIQMKKNMDFLESTKSPINTRFDITS